MSSAVICTDSPGPAKVEPARSAEGRRSRNRGAAGRNDQNQASVATACSRAGHGRVQLMA
jgi:hypothetical protein